MCCALCIHALCGPWVMRSMGQYTMGMWIAAVDPALCCLFRMSQCMNLKKQDHGSYPPAHWVPTTKPDLSRHKISTHPWTASPMDMDPIMHGPHTAWVSHPPA
jgi:hypothetical protein